MTISPQAAAELAALTQVIDDPEIDLLRSLIRLTQQVQLAVPSYLGVSISLTASLADVVTIDVMAAAEGTDVMAGTAEPPAVRSSLKIPAPAGLFGGPSRFGPGHDVTLVVYAATPGALVDLAADLGWLTGLALAEFAPDEHLAGPRGSTSSLQSASLADQAIGVLLGRGHTPEQATTMLDDAAAGGVGRRRAAQAILDELAAPAEPRSPDAGSDSP